MREERVKIPGMTGIEACVFDAYDTLFDLNSAAKANGYRVPWCNRLGQAPARIPEQSVGRESAG